MTEGEGLRITMGVSNVILRSALSDEGSGFKEREKAGLSPRNKIELGITHKPNLHIFRHHARCRALVFPQGKSSMFRQDKAHRGSFPLGAFYLHLPAVCLDKMFDDCKAQACAAKIP